MQVHLMVSQQPQTVASGEAQIVATVVPAAQRKESSPATLELSTAKMNPQAPWWNKRLRIGAAAPSRAPFPNRISAFEKAVRCFADNSSENVITPVPGTSFDSLSEAYDFYNLYSWEKGFGIRYGKSRLNVKRTKCIQQQQFDFIMDVFHEDNIAP